MGKKKPNSVDLEDQVREFAKIVGKMGDSTLQFDLSAWAKLKVKIVESSRFIPIGQLEMLRHQVDLVDSALNSMETYRFNLKYRT